jgi:hypothetical protein
MRRPGGCLYKSMTPPSGTWRSSVQRLREDPADLRRAPAAAPSTGWDAWMTGPPSPTSKTSHYPQAFPPSSLAHAEWLVRRSTSSTRPASAASWPRRSTPCAWWKRHRGGGRRTGPKSRPILWAAAEACGLPCLVAANRRPRTPACRDRSRACGTPSRAIVPIKSPSAEGATVVDPCECARSLSGRRPRTTESTSRHSWPRPLGGACRAVEIMARPTTG